MNNNIYQKLWDLDANAFTVTWRDEQGNWLNPQADIKLEEQHQRYQGNDYAEYRLFSQINQQKLSQGCYPAFEALLNNYQIREGEYENYSQEERHEIDNFVNACFYSVGSQARPVMQAAYDYITTPSSENGLGFAKTKLAEARFSSNTFGEDAQIDLSSYDSFKNSVRNIWFGLYTNYYSNAEAYCSGFEHVFVGEMDGESHNGRQIRNGKVGGYHYWLKFYYDERKMLNEHSQVDYWGCFYGSNFLRGQEDNYFGRLNPDVATLKMRWEYEGHSATKKKGGFFVGLSPECMIAIGTVALFENIYHQKHPESNLFDPNDFRTITLNGRQYKLATWRETLSGHGKPKGYHFRSFWPQYLVPVGGASEDIDTIATDTGHSSATHLYREPLQQGDTLIIESLLPNPSSPQDQTEWVKIRNISNSRIRLSKWMLQDKHQRQIPVTTEDAWLAPGYTLRIHVRQQQGDFALSNSGGQVTLINRQGQIMSQVDYPRVGASLEDAVFVYWC